MSALMMNLFYTFYNIKSLSTYDLFQFSFTCMSIFAHRNFTQVKWNEKMRKYKSKKQKWNELHNISQSETASSTERKKTMEILCCWKNGTRKTQNMRCKLPLKTLNTKWNCTEYTAKCECDYNKSLWNMAVPRSFHRLLLFSRIIACLALSFFLF